MALRIIPIDYDRVVRPLVPGNLWHVASGGRIRGSLRIGNEIRMHQSAGASLERSYVGPRVTKRKVPDSTPRGHERPAPSKAEGWSVNRRAAGELRPPYTLPGSDSRPTTRVPGFATR